MGSKALLGSENTIQNLDQEICILLNIKI